MAGELAIDEDAALLCGHRKGEDQDNRRQARMEKGWGEDRATEKLTIERCSWNGVLERKRGVRPPLRKRRKEKKNGPHKKDRTGSGRR